jgi:hypothetical protein
MPRKPEGRIYNDITETMGGTPLVRINRLVPPGQGIVLAKCEFFNPLSSVKDRIGVAMIEDAEQRQHRHRAGVRLRRKGIQAHPHDAREHEH